MADKQIGIKLDVKSTGLKQVDDALDSVSKNLKELNGKVMDQQQKGWGSEAQTKELREQLRYMQQLLQMTERMARTRGISSEKFGQYGGEISSMQRDLSSVPSYRNPVSGWIHNRFGSNAASTFERGATMAGRIGAGLVAFDLLSTIRSGLSTGTQLAYGYGDLAKRMSPGGSALQYGKDLSRSLQGYGYSDTDLLQAATTYGGATGRMNTGKLQSQMQSILQVGRNYGLDLAPVVQNFASMFQAGVTGGAGQQLSPQEYANLVANAVNRGNMQGKEMQVLGQLQQATQLGLYTSGQSGDIRQLGGLLSLINRSGNQGLISNSGTVLQGLNNMIASPGGGYAGQALIMQALQKSNPGMSYFQLMDLASQGLGNSGNLKSVMSSISAHTKDKDQMAYLMSQMGGGNQHLIRQFLDTAIKPDGTFDQQAIDDFAKSSIGSTGAIPQNDVDAARNRTRSKENAANNVGIDTVPGRSYIDSVQGGLIDQFGAPLVYGAEGLMAFNMGYGAYKFGKGAYKFGKRFFPNGRGPGGMPPSGPVSSVVPETEGIVPRGNVIQLPNKNAIDITPKRMPSWGKFLGPLGDLFAMDQAVNIGDSLGDWFWGHQKGQFKPNGLFSNPFKHETYTDTKDPIWVRMFQKKDETQTNHNQALGSQEPVSGSQLAPIVASTIVALGPYMGQLKPYLALDNTNGPKPMNDLVYRGNGFTTNDLIYRGNSSGLRLASVSGVSGGDLRASSPGSSVAFSGSTSSFVQQMFPYAQQAAMKTGLPVEFILGQWGHESGWGTSDAARNNNNFAGIKPWWDHETAGPNKTYAGYSSLSDFADGYSDFLLKNKRYKDLISAARNGASDDKLSELMGSSGYAEDPNYGSKLSGAIGSVQKTLTVKGEVTVNVKQPDGSVTQVKAPMTAEWTGIEI